MLEFVDLLRIKAVAEHGGFSAAARALGMTQPALARSVAAAEAALRGALFHRSRSGSEPTALCRLILAEAGPILERMQALHDRIAPFRGGSGEEIAVAAGPFPFEAVCVPAALALARRQPRVRLRFETMAWPGALARLRAGVADVAVVTARATGTEDFAALALPPLPLVFAVRRGHGLARRPLPSLGEVLRHPLVTTAHLAAPLQAALAAGRDRRGPDIAFPAMFMESMSGWARVAMEGDHVAIIVPSALSAALRAGDLVALPVPVPAGPTGLLALRPPGRTASTAVAAFLDEMATAAAAMVAESRRLCLWLEEAPALTPPGGDRSPR